MKKILLLLLVAGIPFASISQKRSKKNTKTTEETKTKETTSASFMIIKGVELTITEGMDEKEMNANSVDMREEQVKQLLKPNAKLFVTYDMGNSRSKEMAELMSDSRNLRSMAEAVNKAAKYGWQFVSSDVVKQANTTTYYFYMKR